VRTASRLIITAITFVIIIVEFSFFQLTILYEFMGHEIVKAKP